MTCTVPHTLSVFLILVSLALFAIPVAGTGGDVSIPPGENIGPGVGNDTSRWSTAALVNNVSPDYPVACWGTRVFAAARGPGDVFYLTYFDLNRHALVLVKDDHGKLTGERVNKRVDSVRYCGVSLDIDPVTGQPAVSYRARNSLPVFAHKQNGSWAFEIVDWENAEGYSTSLAFDRAGTPHIAYDDGSSFSSLMYATRNPDGTWTKEIADRGIGGHLGNAGKNPQLRITDGGAYIAHGDGSVHSSLRFTWKPAGGNWTSVTVDRGWGGTGVSSIPGITGAFPSFTMEPGGIATIIYEDALNQTLMKARGPLANDSFETSVFTDADGKTPDGLYPIVVDKDPSGRTQPGRHLAFVGSTRGKLSYADISADPAVLPRVETIPCHAFTSTIASDYSGKPHIFYLDSDSRRIKHAWVR